METWGTLSTHDHRSAVLKKSLVLFDRLLVPIPDAPIYDLSREELDELSRSVEFLEQHDAAVSYTWDSKAFQGWRRQAIRESLSVGRGDSLYDSRIMLVDTVQSLAEARGIEAAGVPVYGSKVAFEQGTSEIERVTESLLVGVSRQLYVPEETCSLAELIELRDKESFQVALKAFRDWQHQVLPQLLLEDSMARVEQALGDFKKMATEYDRIMAGTLQKRRRDLVVSVLSLGGALAAAFQQPATIPLLLAATPALFTLDDLRQPAWRVPQDSKYAAAGIIYETRQHFAGPPADQPS